ncbi:MAG TPA: flagellar hook-length control protein [Thermoanaerobaculia bacterium]|nr:flagellar hook-length control protein [Thermoanaerobaculia bacterium]
MKKIAFTLALGLALASATALLASGGRGMTWAKDLHNSTYSVDHVGCSSCDPYVGDTLCTTALPVLCVRNDASPNPGVATDFYNGWIAGHIHLTPAVLGTSLSSLAAANSLCVSYFGPGYQMAEFHHPAGGWTWYAYGNVNNATRFWVSINDQTANCWNP